MRKFLAILVILSLINYSYQGCSGCVVNEWCDNFDDCNACPDDFFA
jgi:hypothetical protein